MYLFYLGFGWGAGRPGPARAQVVRGDWNARSALRSKQKLLCLHLHRAGEEREAGGGLGGG